jgi:cobalt-zinc-cadmium efflux system protein
VTSGSHDHSHDPRDHGDHAHSGAHAGHAHAKPIRGGALAHSHAHGHGHAHGGGEAPTGAAFALGVALNLLVVAIEIVAGLASHSMALLADAGHNAADVLAVALAWAAAVLARGRPSGRHTYGLRSTTIFAAAFNAATLLAVTGAIAWEAIQRIAVPAPVDGRTVALVAALAVAANAASALLFARSRHHDLNARAVFLHLAGDAAIALGVAVSGLVLAWTGWARIDPIVSLVLSVTVIAQSWPLFRQATSLALHAAPDSIDLAEVRRYLCALPGVAEVHDLHVWAMSTTEVALTAHVAMPAPAHDHGFFARVNSELHSRFGIHHATLQVECPQDDCHLASDDVV